jgi:dTDP-4-dehydrorhamnose 3,5-epimerase
MRIQPTSLDGVLVIDPKISRDSRGFFMESWNRRSFADAVGVDVDFVQDNHSRSAGSVLRGIHYQVGRPQGKLVRVVSGRIFDVAVDLRRASPTFGRWVGIELSAENHRQLWIPVGFGHAFLVLSDAAEVLYKATEYWMPQHDRSLRWDDPDIGIEWPLDTTPVLSSKDSQAPWLVSADVFL